jgi:hypothetical protein
VGVLKNILVGCTKNKEKSKKSQPLGMTKEGNVPQRVVALSFVIPSDHGPAAHL